MTIQAEKRQTFWLAIVRDESDFAGRDHLAPIFINGAPFWESYILVKVAKGRSVLVTDARQLGSWIRCTDNTYLRWPSTGKVLPLRSACAVTL